MEFLGANSSYTMDGGDAGTAGQSDTSRGKVAGAA